MEHQSSRSNSGGSTPEQMSRIFDDLRDSPHHPATPVNGEFPSMLGRFASRTSVPHVCVIGAGISGLRCADVLLQSNIKVTILEGRNRVGGRIGQTRVGKHLVDLGANWIHGNQGNPITSIAKNTNTVTTSYGDEEEEKELLMDWEGHPMPLKMSTQLSDIFWGLVVQAFRYSNDNSQVIPKEKSLQDYLREKLDESELSTGDKKTVLGIASIWGAFVGDPIHRQSLKFFFLEECVEGSNDFVASTYEKILQKIAKKAKELADIQYNKEVVSIEAWPRKPVGSRKITVKTACGMESQFDEVVVSCPLGWLKRNKAAFNPALPTRISSAIDNISYGRLEKVYINFPSPFWHGKAVSNGEAAHGSTQNGNRCQNGDATKESRNLKDDSRPSRFHFLHPNYIKLPSEVPLSTSWDQECISLADLPEGCTHPTLLFYLYGSCSTYVSQRIAPLDPNSPSYYAILDEIFHPFYSRLPSYSADNPACTPVAFLATTWQSDKFAGYGSYTNYQVGLEEGDKDILAMRKGEELSEERGVWLAGEHTSPFIALGTTTGAYWSGEGVARRIAKLYGMRCEVSTDGSTEEADEAIKDLAEGNYGAFEDKVEGRPPGAASGHLI